MLPAPTDNRGAVVSGTAHGKPVVPSPWQATLACLQRRKRQLPSASSNVITTWTWLRNDFAPFAIRK